MNASLLREQVEIVPRVVIDGNGENGTTPGSNGMDGLLTLLLSEKLGVPVNGEGKERSPETATVQEQIRAQLEIKDGDGAGENYGNRRKYASSSKGMVDLIAKVEI